MNINPKKGNLHKKSVNLFPAPATFKLRRKIFEESTKFIVVRKHSENFSGLVFHFFEGAAPVWEAGVSLQGQTCRFYKVGLVASLLKYLFPDYSKEPFYQEPCLYSNAKAGNWQISKEQEVKISDSDIQVKIHFLKKTQLFWKGESFDFILEKQVFWQVFWKRESFDFILENQVFWKRESFDFILAELDKRAASEEILIDGHFIPYSRYIWSKQPASIIPISFWLLVSLLVPF